MALGDLPHGEQRSSGLCSDRGCPSALSSMFSDLWDRKLLGLLARAAAETIKVFVSSSFLAPVDIAELFRRLLLRAFVERELIHESVAENMAS